MSVNESKTEVCAFQQKHTTNIEIVLNNVTVKSKQTMDVLGAMFDSSLSWTQQVSQTITRSTNRTVVVERSRESYLIGVLGMLKVEGSNPGHPKKFIFVSECQDKNELDFRWGRGLRQFTGIACPYSKLHYHRQSFVSSSLKLAAKR